MTKFTKERLEEIVELAKKATYKPCAMHMTNLLVVCDSEVIEEMARQLLAGMKQEPVAWQWLYRDKCHVTNDPARAKFVAEDGDVTVTPLYAAPQLPQPAVPEDHGLLLCPFCGGKPEEDAGGCSEYDGHEHQDYSISCKTCGAEVYCAVGSFEKADVPCSCHHNTRAVCVDKWNRRAGMLQGAEPVSQPYTLRDGWVAVPADMTPDMMREVQLNSELGAYAAANLSGAYSLFREFWGIACRAAGNYPAIPEGYVLVPIEPTAEMCDVKHVGVDVYTGIAADEYYSIGGEDAAKVWKAMLAAAPNQEAK